MPRPDGAGVRVSGAYAQADLDAAVRPGAGRIYLPLVEAPEQVIAAADTIRRLERVRGIRPGTLTIKPLIETATGVSRVGEIAASSERVRQFGIGPKLWVNLDVEPNAETLEYARGECELAARALDLEPVHTELQGD